MNFLDTINTADFLEIEEFIDKYKINLEKDRIIIDMYNEALLTIIKLFKDKKDTIINCINELYDAFYHLYYISKIDKYYNSAKIKQMIESAIKLKDIGIDYNIPLVNEKTIAEFYDIKNICISIYKNIKKEDSKLNLLPENIPEEFKIDHITDLRYHFSNFAELAKDDIDFLNILDKYSGMIN